MPSIGTPAKNSRTRSSAAAFAGVIGLPDAGCGPIFNDGGLYDFCRTRFIPAANQFLAQREHRDRRLGRTSEVRATP